MAFQPHKFGRYIIVDPIAVGGMAEIYRARLAASKEGPDRVIVIKKVIANLSQNSEFISMFEEEIKITVGLTHPNIIQIYDYGKVDEQYFMAMEYVEGKNLRQFVKRLADMKSMFSIDMSCYIISQICHALAYAHAFKDRMSGKSLGIVHRDISPQNIMISYDGAVKLFDFGIAKAKSASEATRAGVIKGKPSYLSPEQINGEELDGRCDIFALGIVLWELLTAKRLFVADTDMGVLRLIQSAKIEPPSTFNPAVPQGLDAIVLRSLTRDKAKRYQGAEEFQRDLHKFLYSFNPSFNPADLSYYAQELFKNEIKEDRERLAKFLAIDPVDDGRGDGNGHAGAKPKLSNKLADGLISTTDFNREMMDHVAVQNTGSFNVPKLENESVPSLAADAKSPSMPSVGAKAPLGVPGGQRPPGNPTQISMRSQPGIAPPKRGAGGEPMVIPPWSKPGSGAGMARRTSGTQTALSRELASENRSSASRSAVMTLLGLFVVAVIAARQMGMLCGTPLEALATDCGVPSAPAPVQVTAAPTEPPPAPVAQQPGGNAPSPDPQQAVPPEQRQLASVGTVMFRTTLQDYHVLVNGQPVSVANNQMNVPINKPLSIEVMKRGFQTMRFSTELKSPSLVAFELKPVAVPMGTVMFSTTPSATATFWLGQERVYEGPTPVREQLPAGRYRVELKNSLLNINEAMELEVESGKLTRVMDKAIGVGK